eukprot:2308890-Amphidinium_carterae.1
MERNTYSPYGIVTVLDVALLASGGTSYPRYLKTTLNTLTLNNGWTPTMQAFQPHTCYIANNVNAPYKTTCGARIARTQQ